MAIGASFVAATSLDAENPEFKKEHKEDVALISVPKAEEILADKEPYYQNFSSYMLRSKRKIATFSCARKMCF